MRTVLLLLQVLLLAAIASSAFALNKDTERLPAALPIVTDEIEAAVRKLEIIFPGQGKSVEFFHEGEFRPFKKQFFKADGTLLQESEYNKQGVLLRDFKLEADMSTIKREFDPQTGKLLKLTRLHADGKEIETSYRADGESIWLKKETTANGLPVYRYVSPDGRSLLRRFEKQSMTVEVFGKDDVFLYGQLWIQDSGGYRLKEVWIGSGRERRLVFLKEDGVSIDHVDYQISGFVGWSTLKTEPGDQLSEPVDSTMLQELNSSDDKSIPQTVPLKS